MTIQLVLVTVLIWFMKSKGNKQKPNTTVQV